MKKKEFKINDYIKLKFKRRIILYIEGKLFQHRKIRLMEIPYKKLNSLTDDFMNKIIKRINDFIENAVQSKVSVCSNCGVRLFGPCHSETFEDRNLSFCCIHCVKAYKSRINLED